MVSKISQCFLQHGTCRLVVSELIFIFIFAGGDLFNYLTRKLDTLPVWGQWVGLILLLIHHLPPPHPGLHEVILDGWDIKIPVKPLSKKTFFSLFFNLPQDIK